MGFFSPDLGYSTSSNGRLKQRGGNFTVVKGMSAKQQREARKAAARTIAEAKAKQDRSKAKQKEQLARKRNRSK